MKVMALHPHRHRELQLGLVQQVLLLGVDTWDPAAFDSVEINDRLAGIKV